MNLCLCPHCLRPASEPGYCKVCADFLGRLTLSPPAAGGSTVRANDAAASCGRGNAVPPAPILTGGR